MENDYRNIQTKKDSFYNYNHNLNIRRYFSLYLLKPEINNSNKYLICVENSSKAQNKV